MKRNCSKILSFVLAVSMVLSNCPTTLVNAKDTNTTEVVSTESTDTESTTDLSSVTKVEEVSTESASTVSEVTTQEVTTEVNTQNDTPEVTSQEITTEVSTEVTTTQETTTEVTTQEATTEKQTTEEPTTEKELNWVEKIQQKVVKYQEMSDADKRSFFKETLTNVEYRSWFKKLSKEDIKSYFGVDKDQFHEDNIFLLLENEDVDLSKEDYLSDLDDETIEAMFGLTSEEYYLAYFTDGSDSEGEASLASIAPGKYTNWYINKVKYKVYCVIGTDVGNGSVGGRDGSPTGQFVFNDGTGAYTTRAVCDSPNKWNPFGSDSGNYDEPYFTLKDVTTNYTRSEWWKVLRGNTAEDAGVTYHVTNRDQNGYFPSQSTDTSAKVSEFKATRGNVLGEDSTVKLVRLNGGTSNAVVSVRFKTGSQYLDTKIQLPTGFSAKSVVGDDETPLVVTTDKSNKRYVYVPDNTVVKFYYAGTGAVTERIYYSTVLHTNHEKAGLYINHIYELVHPYSAFQNMVFPTYVRGSGNFKVEVEDSFGSMTLLKEKDKNQDTADDASITFKRARYTVYEDGEKVAVFETDEKGIGHVVSTTFNSADKVTKEGWAYPEGYSESNTNKFVKISDTHTVLHLPYGNYTVEETRRPYRLTKSGEKEGIFYTYGLDTTTHNVKISKSSPTVKVTSKEPSLSGVVSLHKESACPSITSGNSLYSLKGAVYTLYSVEGSKEVEIATWTMESNGWGKVKTKDSIKKIKNQDITEAFTNSDGKRSVHGLPLGDYVVKETIAPKNYLLDKNTYKVSIDETNRQNTIYVGNKSKKYTFSDGSTTEIHYVEDRIKGDPISISLEKKDADSATKPYKSLEGAIFEMCYYDTLDDISGKDPERVWYFKTKNVKGKAYLGYNKEYLVNSSKYNSNDLYYFDLYKSYGLPLGTFTIQEVQAPEGYTLENSEIYVGTDKWNSDVILGKVEITERNGRQVAICTIGSGHYYNSVSISNGNKEFRKDVKFVKKDYKTKEVMANIPFKISRLNDDGTVAESHIVVTNAKGIYDSSKINPTVNTNKNTEKSYSSENGVWFGGGKPKSADQPSFVYGKYILDELPCENNKGRQLETDIHFEVKYNDMQTPEDELTCVNIGDITNVPEPIISTTAENAEDRTKLIYDKENATIIDHVDYKYLTVNTSYQIEGELRIKDGTTTGKSIGVKSTSEVFKTPSKYKESKHEICGNKDITFKFNASQYEGKEFVVFEKLYKIKSNGTKELVASHEEINDEGQTIYLPKISTTATNKSTKNHMAYADGEVTINDEVTITSINPKLQYVVKGTVMDKSTGEALLVNGKQITADVNIPTEDLNIVTSDNNASTITVPVEYTFDATGLVGKDVVIYEYLYVNGSDKVIASHEDITDMNQTIHFPSLKTKVVNDATETNMCSLEGITNITDTVTYAGLLAGEYTMKGKVYDPLTNKPLLIDGKEVTGETNFTVDSYISDDVEVKFSFEGKGLNGRKFVVFEELYQGDKLIADHSDISDADQTFKFPDVGTKATDGITDNHIGFATGKATINDEVAYSNLIPGKEYTISGYLMDKDTEKPFLINGKKVESSTTFTPEEESGTVTITYEFDASALQGKTIVVFEDLYYKKIHVVSHADINDKDQTVKYPKLTTTAKSTDTEERLVIPNKKVTVVDTVKYENVLVGETYDVTGYLMVQGTNSPLLVNGKKVEAKGTFKAKAESGTIDLTYKFDGTGLEGQSVVVFENLYLGEAQVAKHEDITDEGQTIHFPKVGTTAKDGKTKTHTGNATTDATIVDTVKYENLVVGKKYTVSGYLMVKDTNKPFLINGKKVTASTTFTAESANGTVDLTYKFDATALKGKDIVVFEDVYYKDIKVATHADINDEDQTIKYPSIKTTATCDGSKQVVRKTAVKITDKVAYENLVKGSKYTMKGILMDKVTGEELDVSGEVETELEFTAKGNDGEINMVYTIDTTNINKTDIVVFEYLYDENDKLIASHEDINDEDQTVHVPEFPPEDTPETGDNSPVVPVILVGLASFLGLGIIMFLKRRKKDA